MALTTMETQGQGASQSPPEATPMAHDWQFLISHDTNRLHVYCDGLHTGIISRTCVVGDVQVSCDDFIVVLGLLQCPKVPSTWPSAAEFLSAAHAFTLAFFALSPVEQRTLQRAAIPCVVKSLRECRMTK